MANKKTTLPKAPGTDTRGNIMLPGGAKVLDLSDYDDMFGPSASEKKESAWDQFKGGAIDALANRLNTKDVVRNFLRSAAPDGISSMFGAYEELKGSIGNIKDSLEQTNASDLDFIARKAKDYLPQLKDYMPESVYDNIDAGLESKIDDYQYTIQGQRNQTAIRARNKEDAENNVIQEALDNIALSAKQSHNRSERAEQVRDKQHRAERGLRDVVQTRRFDFMARTMGMAVDNLSSIKSYQEQFDSGIKRKGLELQFRTYMGIKDLVKLAETSLQLQVEATEALVRNTGTPDYQKGSQADLKKFQRGMAGKRGGGVMNGLANAGRQSLQQYLGGFGGDVEQRVSKGIGGHLSNLVQSARMGENAPGLWDQKYSIAGGLAGNLAGDFLQDHLVPMAGRQLRPMATKLMNKHGGGKHNQAGYFLDNLPAFAQEFVNNNQNQYGIKGFFRDMIAPHVPQFGLNDRVTKGNYQTIDQQASFNQMTQRSITEVIPGFLSMAVQELRMIRTGRDDIERETFDITTGKFAIEKTSNDNLLKRIVPDSAVRSASSTINDALNNMDSDNKLSPQARQALAERMLREASNNKRFDPEQYLKSKGYKDGTSSETTDELGQFFRSKFEFDNKGKMKDTSDNHQLRQDWSKSFLDIRSISRDPYKEIQRLIESGRTEPLRMMGIIVTEGNQDRINYDRIWEILRGGVTDDNPYGPGGSGDDPTRDDSSGDLNSDDFVGPRYEGAGKRFGKKVLNDAQDKFAPHQKAARDAAAKRIRELRARYGNNPAKLAEMMAKFKEEAKSAGNNLSDIYGKGADYTASLMNGSFNPADIKNKALNAYEQTKGAVNKAKDSFVPDGMDKLSDLYSKFDPTRPVIKAKDFLEGSLIDVNTKKQVTKPSDITGAVINELGEVMISAGEVASGLFNANGDTVIKVAKQVSNKIADAIGKHTGKLLAGPPNVGEDAAGNPSEDTPQDLSLSPGESPVITARGIQDGEYFNKSTGKAVTSMADLNGDIVDKDGKIVVTAQEVEEGLYNYKTGGKWRLTKGARRVGKVIGAMGKFSTMTATQIGFHAMKFMGKAALGIASKAFNFVVENQNAYLPDSEDPVFTRRKLKAGEYYDEKGKVIKDFSDSYGLIYGTDGQPVIAKDQYKELMNYDGTKHVLAKNAGIWGRTVIRGLRKIRSAYIAASKRYWKWLGRKTVGAGKWLGKKVFGGAAKVGGNLLGKIFEKGDPEQMNNPTNLILAQILQQLQANEPAPEEREGSWKSKAKKGLAGLGDKLQGKGMRANGKQGLLGGLLGGLGKLMGGGKKKDDDDDDDDDGFGLDDAADLSDINENRKRGRRRRGRGGRGGRAGKVGRMARMGSYLKNSRMGGMAMQGGRALMGTSVARTGLMMGARLAAPLLTGVAALLSAPAWLLVAGVAVVGGAAYMGYRAYKAAGDFKYLRMMQYGITSTGQKLDILKLEALLEKSTDKGADHPHMELNSNIAKEVLSIMGVDPKDEARLTVFSRWMEMRFKPVYLAYCKALGSIGKKDVLLNEIDDKVPDELKGELLTAVTFPYEGSTPYTYDDNPFDADKKLGDTIPEIKEQTAKLTEKFAKFKEKADKEKGEGKDPAKDKDKDKPAGELGKAAGAAAAGVATGATAVAAKDLMAAKKEEAKVPEGVNRAMANVKNAVKVAALSGATAGAVKAVEKVNKELTSLQSIRMRAYGLQTLGIADVESLLTLEYVYSKGLTSDDVGLDFTGDFTVFVREAGTYLGISTGANDPRRLELASWLANRFAPAFRAYWGAVLAKYPAAQLNNVESQLKTPDKITVANAVMGATNSSDDSVWEVDSIFDIVGKLSDLRSMAEADLKHLREVGDKDIAGTPTQKASEQVAGKNNAAMGGGFFDGIKDATKDMWDATKSTAADFGSGVKDAWNGMFGGNSNSGKPGDTSGAPYVNNSGNTVSGTGLVLSDVAKGNGGKWEDVPMPTANGTAKGAAPTFKVAAVMVGIPVDLFFIIAGIESNYQYDIKAKPSINKKTGKKSKESSAYGWFQFLNDTWDAVYLKVQKQFGAPPDDSARSMRKDPRLQALAGGIFMQGNYEGLKKRLGRPISDTDVYIAHFLGLGGATTFLKADPAALGIKVFPEASESNVTIFYNGSKPRTIAEIYKLFDDKIAPFRQGGKNATATDVPQTVGEPKSPEAIQEAQVEKTQATTEIAPETDPKEADDKASPSGGNTTQSPGAMIASTAPGAPGMSPASTNGSPASGAPGPSQDSGASAAEAQRLAQEENVLQAQQRREQELRKSQQSDKAVDDIQNKQLTALTDIRDYMKLMYEAGIGMGNTGAANSPNGGNNTSAGSGTNNSMNSPIQNRTAQHRASPLSLK